ncbi:MAG: hypothetical protein J3Q66DRAFT_440953 [Benniella sp.]|nr:MAG: hypothetical protein J3Q66DRAFT_440953 [Benniella sp.]
MPQSPSSPSIFTFFIFTLTCLFCISSSPSVLAQKYRPVNLSSKCNAFVEGQALYLDYFVLDLSVPWNASDPGFKKLMPHPDAQVAACAITSNGEDLFVMSAGTGYIYNVKSNSWKPFPNPNFAPYATEYFSAVTDPETGIIYLPNGGVDFAGRKVMLSVDIKTRTVTTTGSNPYMSSRAVWNEYLRSIVVAGKDNGLMVFTPSNVTGASDGWDLLNISPPEDSWYWDCGASAYGGSMMVFISYAPPQLASVGNTVHILDVVKQTWKKGPPVPGGRRDGSSCAVSGDQFIVWGGSIYEEYANRTRIFNLKTEKWVSRYTPPPPRPTATTLQPSQTPVTAFESGSVSSNEKRLVTIIVAVTGTLLAIILGLIFRFYRRTRQLDPHGPSTVSSDIKDSDKTPKPGLVGRLHEGVFGANQVSEHPHAIVEDPTAKRNLQEGAHEIQIPPQHPHTMVGRQEPVFQTTPHPSVLAQKFIPDVDQGKCSFFVEGQAFYMLGGFRHPDGAGNFMIDLSVPWNASDPVYKELTAGPIIDGHGCGMANTGELFVLSAGTAFVYNLKSSSWTVFDHPNLSTSTRGEFAVTDPETGIIYIKDEYVNLNGDSTMYSVDLRTKTVNTSKVYIPERAFEAVAWSAFMKSVVVVDRPVSLYTPSEGTKSSKGRSTFLATGLDGGFPTLWCTAPAYGGVIIVFLGDYFDIEDKTYVHILDLNTRNWRKGSLVNARIRGCSCAVSGDHFIDSSYNVGERGNPIRMDHRQVHWMSKTAFRTPTRHFGGSDIETPSVLAQEFVPYADRWKCSAFVEGQAFYLLAGLRPENFMIDLSVSWNTSDPVYKKLRNGGPEYNLGCAITNNGEDLLVLGDGKGYIYNTKLNSWKLFPNANFATIHLYSPAVSDPETGIIYLPAGGEDLAGKMRSLSVDLRMGTVKPTAFSPLAKGKSIVLTWSAHLRSMVVPNATYDPALFTPSKVTDSSDGWSTMSTTGKTAKVASWKCGAPAYGGSIIVYLGAFSLAQTAYESSVFTLDVVNGTWKQGPPVPKGFATENCAVSGDQFIVWGYMQPRNVDDPGRIFVFNMKTERWVSEYVATPLRPTTTSYALQPSQTPTQNTTASELGETSSDDRKPTIIAVAVTGCLLAIIVGLFVYRRRTRQPNSNGPSSGSLDVKDDVNTSRKGDPSEPGHARLHQGVFGAELVSEHPHAIVEDPTMQRSVQEGAHAVQIPPQHPHIMVGKQEHAFPILLQHPHAIGKAELEEQ